jgi:hypothetical protein
MYHIHAYPVKDGLIALPGEWEFSNYRVWMKLRAGVLVNRGFFEDYFGTPEAYKKQVMEFIKTRKLPDEIKDSLQRLED